MIHAGNRAEFTVLSPYHDISLLEGMRFQETLNSYVSKHLSTKRWARITHGSKTMRRGEISKSI